MTTGGVNLFLQLFVDDDAVDGSSGGGHEVDVDAGGQRALSDYECSDRQMEVGTTVGVMLFRRRADNNERRKQIMPIDVDTVCSEAR
jgi:hypothetical protein